MVPVAVRHDGWTPARQRTFIEALADHGCVKSAALGVGMSVESAYRLRRRSDARGFDATWEAALDRALDRLLPAALDRALNGTLRTRYYRGEQVSEERVYRDRLLLHLLERGQSMLRRGRERDAIRADWDGAMAILESGEADHPAAWLPGSDHRLWQTSLGMWVTNCPPPRDFQGDDYGSPGGSGYWRTLTKAEKRGLRARLARQRQADEAARRRIFGLDGPGRGTDGGDGTEIGASQNPNRSS